MNSNQTLPETLTAILSHYGAVFSEAKENTCEYLAPEDLAQALHIPDYGKLSFGYGISQEKTIAAFYDSDFFKTLEQFLFDKGRIAQAVYPSIPVNTARVSQMISQTIGFSNAAVRLKAEETKTISYLLLLCKYLAFSDDQQEGFLPILMNTGNSSISFPPPKSMDDLWEKLQDSCPSPFIFEPTSMILQMTRACAAAQIALREELRDFHKSLEKRLSRDIKRVYEYYGTLQAETKKILEKQEKNPENGQNREKLLNKLQAVKAEQAWKIQDVISKYALNISVQPVAVLRIETLSTFFGIEIRRRLNSRSLALTWNPLLKQLDPLCCEGCFFSGGNYSVCDDHLHILCEQCCKICSQCGRKYCGVCCKNVCPRCP